LYRAVIRFMSGRAAFAMGMGIAFSTAALLALNEFVLPSDLSPSVFIIYLALALLFVGGSRFGARELLRIHGPAAERVVVYGAGGAGAQLCASLFSSHHFRPVAIIDDNVKLHGAGLGGLRVRSPDDLLELRRSQGVNLVLLALPSASRRRRSQIIDSLSSQGFKVQTVPDLSEIVSGRARLEEIRDIDVHDLLGRDPVPPN